MSILGTLYTRKFSVRSALRIRSRISAFWYGNITARYACNRTVYAFGITSVATVERLNIRHVIGAVDAHRVAVRVAYGVGLIAAMLVGGITGGW